MLSKYVPAERLQIEFLNKWRNREKYAGDPFAPANYDFEYLFATTIVGQPLAWMEATGLPDEALALGPKIGRYRQIQHALHRGVILPVGDEPSGRSWTGFQSIDGDDGFLIIYREATPDAEASIRTWLPEGCRIRLTPMLGEGRPGVAKVGRGGCVTVRLDRPNSYALYRYERLGHAPRP